GGGGGGRGGRWGRWRRGGKKKPPAVSSTSSRPERPHPSTLAHSAAGLGPAPVAFARLWSIALLQAPVCDLEPSREPHVGMTFGIADELVHDFGAIGNA